jgi:hypothetical protein
MLSTLFVVALSQATAPAATISGPIAMSRAQIRDYNAKLSRDHPSYIRCVRNLDTGSLVKKTTSCRTNAEWRRVEQIGNEDASRMIEKVQTSGSTRGS